MISKLSHKLQNLWSKEWLLKLISLCIAAMLWYFVGGEDIVEKNVMVPIEVINMPNDLIISNKHKRQVEVTVRGPRSAILEMGKDQKARQIDLSKATPGTRVEQIENNSIPVSRGLDVLRVQPSSIILSLDKLIKKEFVINAVTTGNVSPGHELARLHLDPSSITINGPQTILSQVDVLKTTPINISGLTESTQLQIPLELNEAFIDLIGETSVTADITITYDSIEKRIKNVPVQVIIEGFPLEVNPSHVTVTLDIPKIIIDNDMNFRELFSVTAVDDTTAEAPNRMRVQVEPSPDLSVPLEIVAIEPQYVTRIVPETGEQKNSQQQVQQPIKDKNPEKDR